MDALSTPSGLPSPSRIPRYSGRLHDGSSHEEVSQVLPSTGYPPPPSSSPLTLHSSRGGRTTGGSPSHIPVPVHVASPRRTSPPTLPHSPSPPPSHYHPSTLTSPTDTPHSSSVSNSFRQSRIPTPSPLHSPLHSRERGIPRASGRQTTVSGDHITSPTHFASRTGPRRRAPESDGVKSRHSPTHIPVLSRREGSSSPLDFYSGSKEPAFTTAARHRVLDTRTPDQELSLFSADLTEQKRGDYLTTQSRSVLVTDQDRYPSSVGAAFENGNRFSFQHTGSHRFTEDLSPTATASSKKTTSGTSRTVKFLSPVHQVLSEDAVTPTRFQTREEDLAPKLEGGISKVDSRLTTLDPTPTTQLAPSPSPTRDLKDSSETRYQFVPNPSLSHSVLGTTGFISARMVGGLQHTSSENETSSQDEAGSPGKQATGIGHVSSTESLAGSERSEIHSLSAASLASRHSLPASLGSRSAFSLLRGSLSQQEALQLSASLPQLGRTKDSDTSRTHRSLWPHSSSLPLLSSQLGLLQVEREGLESRLRQTQDTITALQAQNNALRDKATRANARVSSLESELWRVREGEMQARDAHRREMGEVERRLRGELEGERERLLNQIRELARMKEEASAQVSVLRASLSEEKQVVRPTAPVNEAAHLREIEALKTELSALQELYEESEQSLEAQGRERRALEEQLDRLRRERSRAVGGGGTGGGETGAEDWDVSLRLRLAERRIRQLEEEKTRTVVETEQRVMADNIKQQVNLQCQLEDARATVEVQEQRIQRLQAELAPREREPAEGRTAGGRWTAHRADVRKHAEEMLLIIEGLEREGYGPTQATADEVIRHLWWEKEHMRGELQKTQQTLRKAVGAEQYSASQELELEKARLESELREVREEAGERQQEAATTQEVLRSKLTEVLEGRAVESELRASLQQREEEVCRENGELRERVREAQRELSEKTALLVPLEADLASTRRALSSTEGELSQAQRQCGLLQAQMDSLTVQLGSRQSELEATLLAHHQSRESSAQQSREEVTTLRAKVGDLEGEVLVLQQEVSHLASQRDSLQQQLDSTSSQLSSLEEQHCRERATSTTLQSRVESLEEELKARVGDLQRVSRRRDDLEVEVSSVRRDLHATQENITTLEMELVALQGDYESCQSDLSQASTSNTDLERKLFTTTAELTHSQEVGRKLQTSLTSAQRKLDSSGLEREKQSSEELRATMASVSSGIEESGRRIETLGAERGQYKRQLAQKRQEVEKLQTETRSLKNELRESKRKSTSLQTEVDRLQRELKAQKKELVELQESHLSVQQRATKAHKELAACRRELKGARVQLAAVEAENTSLAKEKRAVPEAQDLRQRLSGVSSELSEKEEALQVQRELKEKEREMETYRLQVEQLRCSLGCEQERYSTLEMELASTGTRLKQSSERCEALTSQLQQFREEWQEESDRAKQTEAELQLELKHTQDQYSELYSQYATLDAENTQNTASLQRATAEASELRVRHSVLTSDLAAALEVKEGLEKRVVALDDQQRRTLEEREAVKEVEGRLLSLQASLEAERRKWEGEREQLTTDLTHSREQLSSLKSELHSCGEELTDCRARINMAEEKCLQLETALHSKASTLASLQASHVESQFTVQELSQKLEEEYSTGEQLKAEVECLQEECGSLRDQLQLQMETAAASINRVHQHSHEKSSDLNSKMHDLSARLKKMHSSTKSLQQDLSQARAENAKLGSQLAKAEAESSSFREKLRSQTAAIRLSEQKAEQLQTSLKIEQKAKSQLDTALSEERAARSESESQCAHHQQHLAASGRELAQLQAVLETERTQLKQCQNDLGILEAEVVATRQQLEVARQSHRTSVKHAEKEATALKQRHHSEKKALKEKHKELQNNMQTLRAQYDSRGDEISRLGVANQGLTEDQRELVRRLTEAEHALLTKKEECKNLEVRKQALEVQVSHLQLEMSTLTQAQVEMEQHRKRMEASSRADLRHILAEVTDHMEQQYSAHRYLEKLRTENEAMALKDRERQIGQLKHELKQKCQEGRQERLQKESLELEAKYLRSHQKEQERSRRRLESRLERVSETLNHSLPGRTPFTHQSAGPLHSTPSYNKSYC